MTEHEKKVVEEKLEELLHDLGESFKHHNGKIDDRIKFLPDDPKKAEWTAIGYEDGLLNYIYRVRDPETNTSVIVKWARLVIRIQEIVDIGVTEANNYDLLGIRRRNPRECNALKMIETFVPGSTPKILYADRERYFFIMEDLSGYTTLKGLLDEGVVIPEVFPKVTTFLANLHRATHVNVIGADEFRKIKERASKDNTLDESYTKWLYDESFADVSRCRQTVALKPVLPQLIDNQEIKSSLKVLSDKYNKNQQTCFIHNDSHPGFAMVDKDTNDVKFIDAELSRMGYPARDIGFFLGEVILWYYVNAGRNRHDACRQIRRCAENVVLDYMKQMEDLLEPDFLVWVAGMAGLICANRTANIMPHPQFEGLEQAEADCVQVAINLIKNMKKINSVDTFIDVAFGKEE